MIKMFQSNWFGIDFATFTDPDPSKQADEAFYDLFYEQFFKKFNSYDELPLEWKAHKSSLANFIFSHVQYKKATLSIGCGNGYIENELSKMKFSGTLTAIEPSITASRWLKDNEKITLIHGYFPDALKTHTSFDFAYMSYIEYVFQDEAYVNILKEIKAYPIHEFLLVGASTYPSTVSFLVKHILKTVLIRLGVIKGQLWGYQRSLEEHLSIFQQAGYENVEHGKLSDGTLWIKARNE